MGIISVKTQSQKVTSFTVVKCRVISCLQILQLKNSYQKLLSTPATSIPCESVFSAAGLLTDVGD